MLASNFINHNIPTLSPTDNADRALDFMDEYKVTHLPVVFKDQYLGILSETTLLNSFDTFGQVSQFKLEYQNIFLSPSAYIYDIIDALVKNGISIVPIINEQQEFEGVVTANEIIQNLAEISAVKSPGTILEILLKSNDYSLAEVSRIIETNGTKILSSFIRPYNNDPARLLLSLKLSTENSSAVIAALERFQYDIVVKSNDASEANQDIDRLHQLFKYLNT